MLRPFGFDARRLLQSLRFHPRLLLQSLQLGASRLFLLPQPRRLVHPRVVEPPTQRATPAQARADGGDERGEPPRPNRRNRALLVPPGQHGTRPALGAHA